MPRPLGSFLCLFPFALLPFLILLVLLNLMLVHNQTSFEVHSVLYQLDVAKNSPVSQCPITANIYFYLMGLQVGWSLLFQVTDGSAALCISLSAGPRLSSDSCRAFSLVRDGRGSRGTSESMWMPNFEKEKDIQQGFLISLVVQ